MKPPSKPHAVYALCFDDGIVKFSEKRRVAAGLTLLPDKLKKSGQVNRQLPT